MQKMLKSERGVSHIGWVVIILIILVLAVIFIKVSVGENGLIQQMEEKKQKNQIEQNMMVELTNYTKY